MASLLPLFLQNGMGRTPLEAGFAMLPFALAMLALPYIGCRLSHYMRSSQVLVTGLLIVAVGNAVTGFGAYFGLWPTVMVGMFLLGSGGGLLNGETQKAIMGTVPRDRSGIGISTTSRFSGILMRFAVLSGVLATVMRNWLTHASGNSGTEGGGIQRFADAVVPQAISGITGSARDLAIEPPSRSITPNFDGEVTHLVDLDRRIISRGKYDLDVVVHYARPTCSASRSRRDPRAPCRSRPAHPKLHRTFGG